MDNIILLIKKYCIYIISVLLVFIVVLIGFIYSNYVTIKNNDYVDKEVVSEDKETKKEEKQILKVDIKGEIKKPGVYEIEENDRVIDIINKAGGLTKRSNTDHINLSKKLKDESVIIIYSDDEIEKFIKDNKEIKTIIKYEPIEIEKECPNNINNSNIIEEKKDNKTEDNSSDKLININSATKEELMTLTGVGESKAELIISYRNVSKFENIEDIKKVKSIGDSLFEKIKDNITV